MRSVTAGRTLRERGFTLIEVLIAMVILAIGLMGLQALGVRSVRSLGEADRNSRAAATATRVLENALGQLRMSALPARMCQTLANGDVVSREVDVMANRRLVQVTVTVTPEPRGTVPRPFTTQSHSYLPDPVSVGEEPSGESC